MDMAVSMSGPPIHLSKVKSVKYIGTMWPSINDSKIYKSILRTNTQVLGFYISMPSIITFPHQIPIIKI